MMDAAAFLIFPVSKEAVLLFKGAECIRDLDLAFKSSAEAEVVPNIQEPD